MALGLPAVACVIDASVDLATVDDLPIVVGISTTRPFRLFIDAFRGFTHIRVIRWPAMNSRGGHSRRKHRTGGADLPQNTLAETWRAWHESPVPLRLSYDSNTAPLVRATRRQVASPVPLQQRPAAPRKEGPVHAADSTLYQPRAFFHKFYAPQSSCESLVLRLCSPPLAMPQRGAEKTILQVYVVEHSAHEFMLGKIWLNGDRPRPMVLLNDYCSFGYFASASQAIQKPF